MTIEMLNRVISASEFRAKCLGLLDELVGQGGTITVTKRGRPVAIVKPAKKTRYKSPRGAWVGKIEIVGDIANEDTSQLWNVLREGID
jgi:prevent-host-death family protein